MTTIVNTPGNGDGWDSWFGMVIGVVVFLVVILLAYLYVLPAVNNTNPQKDININVKVPSELPTKNPIPILDPTPAPKPTPTPATTP